MAGNLIYSPYYQTFDDDRLEDVTHIHGNIWMGSVPIGEANRDFHYIINLYSYGEGYDIDEHQIMVSNYMVDDNVMVPDSVINHLVDIAHNFSTIDKTLIHCHAGLNRSGLITALTLVKGGMDPAAAIKLIRQKRSPRALNNQTFVKYIMDRK